MNRRIIAQIVSIAIFIIVFYKKSIGLNLAIFEIAAISLLFFSNKPQSSKFSKLFLLSTIATLIASLVHHSSLSLTLNYISFFMFISAGLYKEFKSLLSIFMLSFRNFFLSSFYFVDSIFKSNNKKNSVWSVIKRGKYFIIPLVFVFIFISLYSVSSPDFNAITDKVVNFFISLFENLPALDWVFIGVLLLAIILSSPVFYSRIIQDIITSDQSTEDTLVRSRKRRSLKQMGLKHEFRAGVFLLVILNMLILIVNVTDILNVWINFNWTGQFLKEFVHKGTYTLIMSILLSIGIVVYYFRGNLNFFTKNKRLLVLANIWILQNILLTISVGVRNLRYIEHFALAYKRIGVLFFLAATLYGLYTVYKKVNNKKTTSYLIRVNSLSVYVIILVMSLINWDSFIINYNVKHADKSFLHFNYLSSMPDNCLPLLNKNKSFWEEKEVIQNRNFDFFSSSSYMKTDEFIVTIGSRIEDFKNDYEKRSWLEWNYGDWKAYKELNSEEN